MVRQSLVDVRTAWRGALAGLAVGLALALLFASQLLIAPFTALQDRLFPAPPPDPGVTLVAIDQAAGDKFLSNSGATAWPYSNEYHAAVIDNLARLKPKVLVVDIVFDHASGLRCESEALSTGVDLADTPAGLLAGQQRCATTGALINTDEPLITALKRAQVPVVIACSGGDRPVAAFADAVRAGRAGVVASRDLGVPDAANAVRSVPVGSTPGCGDPAFEQAVSLATGAPIKRSAGALDIGSHHVPVTANRQMLINFSNGRGATCTYIAVYTNQCPRALITGRIVVVGVRILNADDVHPQPVAFDHGTGFCPTAARCMNDNDNYGYRILADEIATVWDDRYLRTQPDLSIELALLLLGTVVGAIAYVLPFRVGFLFTAVVVAGYIAGIVLLAEQAGWLADPLFAPAAIVGAAAAALAARFLIEERERRKLEAIFGRYVDPSVMHELVALDSVDALRVGGERRPITVLFADVRGFTTASETMPAEEVVRLLNEFTTRCTRCVFEAGGTVDKFIGDCVMAFWNAPTDLPDHADRAVSAALAILNEPAASGPLGPVGIGIYTGEAVVGNVGDSFRVSYTAIGDTVNTASRLCSAAPARTLYIGETTWELLADKPAAERCEPMQVKGRTAPVGVYSVSVAETETVPA